jgi:hypothetical protein
MEDKSASQQIDDIIQTHGGWKAEIVSKLRAVILQADSGMVEEIKWRMATRPEGLAVWAHEGIVCFAEIWKDNVKLLFPKGAEMKDPNNLFNSRLKSLAVRAIEFREGDSVNETAFKELVLEAVQVNKTKNLKR